MKNKVTVMHGDCLQLLPTLDADSVHAVVTDPPYHLTTGKKGGSGIASLNLNSPAGRSRISTGFMGKVWDGGDIAMRPETWAEVYRVMKPGAHLVAFGGTRTSHRMVCAIEDAGFEVRDTLCWLYGSGFSKGFNLKRAPICDCIDGGNTLPYNHGKQTSEYGLRPLREADLSTGEYARDQCGEVLQPCVSQQNLSQLGRTRTQSKTSAGEQSGLEGWKLHRAGEGLSDDPDAGPSSGTSEWLRVGTHLSSGRDDGETFGDRGGGSSSEPRSGRQSTEQSESLCEPSGALDGGTLFGCGACPRCGKLRKEYEGFSTSLKPAHEPIILARKPLQGGIAANVLKHGTGGINIDACRVPSDENTARTANAGTGNAEHYRTGNRAGIHGGHDAGRFPANVLHDGSDEVLAAFAAYGEKTSGSRKAGVYGAGGSETVYGERGLTGMPALRGDFGSAARFFKECKPTEDELRFHYSAKADTDDRAGSKHPTIKPIDLVRWLCRLITPPGGMVLDPFAGSGTTGEAAVLEGFRATLIEQDAAHVKDIRRRLGRASGDDTPLFAAQ